MNKVKKFLAASSAALLMLGNSAFPALAVEPWNVTDSYVINFKLDPDVVTVYPHDAFLTQTGTSVSGSGGHPAGGAYTYEWDVTTGSVSGSTINLTVTYDVGAPGTVMTMTGSIAPDGSMSGTWTDNFGGTRTGTWATVEGNATPFTLEACGDMTFDNIIVGTDQSDNLVGTSGRDLILAKDGSDLVDGLGGDDCIVGGDGTDKLIGSGGNDRVLGQDGSDYIEGNGGDDTLLGGGGSDKLKGGTGMDNLNGNSGADSLEGGADADTILGGDGADLLKGEGGDDSLNGQSGVDSALGGAGSDTCTAENESGCEI